MDASGEESRLRLVRDDVSIWWRIEHASREVIELRRDVRIPAERRGSRSERGRDVL